MAGLSGGRRRIQALKERDDWRIKMHFRRKRGKILKNGSKEKQERERRNEA